MFKYSHSGWPTRVGAAVLGALAIASPVAAAGWNDPVLIGRSSHGVAWANSLAVTGNGTAIAVFAEPTGENSYQTTLLSRSTDGGETWSRAMKLSDPSACAAGSPAVSAVGNNVEVAWAEFAHCGATNVVGAVWFARSTDNG